MSGIGGLGDAHAISIEIVELLAGRFPDAHPMQVTAATALALGAMVAACATSGASKPGRSGAVLKNLFEMAETVATQSLERLS